MGDPSEPSNGCPVESSDRRACLARSRASSGRRQRDAGDPAVSKTACATPTSHVIESDVIVARCIRKTSFSAGPLQMGHGRELFGSSSRSPWRIAKNGGGRECCGARSGVSFARYSTGVIPEGLSPAIVVNPVTCCGRPCAPYRLLHQTAAAALAVFAKASSNIARQ